MSEEHPGLDELASYAAGGLAREEAREIERHLAGCAECQRRVDELPPSGGRRVRWQAHRFTRAGEEAARRAREEEILRGERGRKERILAAFGTLLGARTLMRVEELLSEPQHQRRRLLRDDSEHYGGLNLAELLEGRCREAWLRDPAEAVELAKLAVLVAGEADAELYGSKQVADARELSLLHLGLSFRIASLSEVRSDEVAEEREIPVPVGEVEAALGEVRHAFLDRDMWFDVAQTALDHSRILLELGRIDDLVALSAEASAELRERGAPRQAEEPVRYVGHAQGEGELDQDLLGRLTQIVQEYRNDPSMRFGGGEGDNGGGGELPPFGAS
jgi:hypothetical protein